MFKLFNIAAVCLMFVATVFAGEDVFKKDIEINNGWIRPTHGGLKVTAMYFDITNLTDETDYLLSVQFPICGNPELHKSIIEDNIAKMVHIDKIAIPAKQTVNLKPGGIHVMLMNLKKTLTVGEAFNVKLSFQNAGVKEAVFEVKDANS